MTAPRGGLSVTPNIRLVEQLDRGGMGSIWIAEHAALRTRVIVKFMDAALAQDPVSKARFAREAAAAASVRSPHVVQIFDYGVTDDGVPFIVMELLEGRDLADHLSEVGRMSLRDVTRLVSQTAKALQRAHDVGIVHRDIKPENIFLCEVEGDDLFVKLLDFGLAKRREEQFTSQTQTGSTFGTPFYMSPEQIVSPKHADVQDDRWALAVVAFECLTGRRPFEGSTVGAVAVALHRGVRPEACSLVPSLPKAIDDWFARAFARDPAARFATATEMATTFRAIATGSADAPVSERTIAIEEHVSAEPQEAPAPRVRAVLPARARRSLVGAAALLALAGLGVFLARQSSHDVTPSVPVSAPSPLPPASTQAVHVPATSALPVPPSATAVAAGRPTFVMTPSKTIAPVAPTPSSVAPKPAASALVRKKYVDIK